MSSPQAVDAGAKAPQTERRTARRAAFAAALAECRASLLAPDGDSSEAQRRSVSALAVAVRTLQVPPERFLAAFKSMALNAPTIAALPADERMAKLSRLTAIAIDTYYRGNGVDGDTSNNESSPQDV